MTTTAIDKGQFLPQHQLIYKNVGSERPMRVVLGGSGSGTTIAVLLEHSQKQISPLWVIRALFTDRETSKICELGKRYNVEVVCISFLKFQKTLCTGPNTSSELLEKTRILFHQKIIESLHAKGIVCDVVGLAGYMRIVPPTFINHFGKAVINSHPADPREYKGMNTVMDALQAGRTKTRSAIHCVTEGVDEGQVLVLGKHVDYTEGAPVTAEKANRHQDKQKKESDYGAYIAALDAIAKGAVGFEGPIIDLDVNE